MIFGLGGAFRRREAVRGTQREGNERTGLALPVPLAFEDRRDQIRYLRKAVQGNVCAFDLPTLIIGPIKKPNISHEYGRYAQPLSSYTQPQE
jgi:hypothetical protein